MATSSDAVLGGTLRTRERRSGIANAPRAVWKFVRRKPLGGIGLLIVTILFLAAIFADVISARITGYGWDKQQISNARKEPSASHWLGTDERGRDIFTRIVFGARVSIFVGFGTIAGSMLIATAIGTLSGYYGKFVDLAFQRIIDIFLAIPFFILALTLTAVVPKADHVRHVGPIALDPSVQGAMTVMVALGVGLSLGASRVIRGAVLGVKANQYIESARALGASDGRILLRHIIPNIFPTILVLASVQLGGVILAESSLSFLGIGIPAPVVSWGRMLTDSRRYITQSPLLSIWPGLAISITVFGFNMLGDALRDVLDPRLRGSR